MSAKWPDLCIYEINNCKEQFMRCVHVVSFLVLLRLGEDKKSSRVVQQKVGRTPLIKPHQHKLLLGVNLLNRYRG